MKRRLIALALAGALLGGCASPQTDYSPSAAQNLQKRVLAVTEAAAAGDVVAALLRLQELEAAAYDAAARSMISQGRLASILASIALVRADLEKALSQAELTELQKRLDELEQEQPQAPAAPGGNGSSGTGSGNGNEQKKSEQQQKAEEEAAKKEAEQQKKEEEAARKAAEEQRKAEEEARKAEEEAAKKEEEAAKKEAEEQAEEDGDG
ncbi:MAG: hypothetical protein M3116_00055 [Actinomycetota bacterium]|nr:hypothetical protein [Actinomycetota bacterium]